MVAHEVFSDACDSAKEQPERSSLVVAPVVKQATANIHWNGTYGYGMDEPSLELPNEPDDSYVIQQNNYHSQVLKPVDERLKKSSVDNALRDIIKEDDPDTNQVKYLLEFGATSNTSLLKCAIRRRHVGIVVLLLDHHANPNKDDVLGCAVCAGHLEIIQLLLNRNADPNSISRSFVYTGCVHVLGIAVKDKRMDIIQILMEKGADPKYGVVLGWSVINANDKMMIVLERKKSISVGCPMVLITTRLENVKNGMITHVKDTGEYNYTVVDLGILGDGYIRFKLDKVLAKYMSCSKVTKIIKGKLSAICHTTRRIEEAGCIKLHFCESWTTESTEEECRDRTKLLPSKTAFEENDSDVLEIEIEDSFRTEQCSSLIHVHSRLETYVALFHCEADCDLLAYAGFYYTGGSFTCFSCSLEIWTFHDEPWIEHTINSPGCAYVRKMKGPDYICQVLTQFDERREGKHSENHPADVKGRRDLFGEKFLDPPDLVTPKRASFSNGGTDQVKPGDYAVQKHSSLGYLQLFDDVKGEKQQRINLKTSKQLCIVEYLLKYLHNAKIYEPEELRTKTLPRKSKDSLEFIRHLREQSWAVQIDLYMVPDVMSRISSYSLWPHRSIRTGPLVEAGFSCKDPNSSTVVCMSCGLELNASTLNGTTPLDYHRERSPDCEFFHQTNSRNTDVQQTRALMDSPNIPAVLSHTGNNQGANAFLGLPPPGNNQLTTDTPSRAQTGNNQEAKGKPARTPPGYNDGNTCIDEAPSDRRHTENASSQFSNNGAASSEPPVAERPRTGEVFDRAALNVPNNNNVTSSGEALRENENPIAGAVGGDVPYPIRNPRYTEQNARRETYTHWPHRAAHDIDILVNAGFFYTGAEDIVRCYYCDIGLAEWNPDDDPWVEHARHSPECPYLRDQKGQDYINNIQTQWARIYTPKHPQHTQADARRRTFENAGWPRDNVLQAPEQLAAAGFFYTGEGDTVRCHYCDGGLREWEPQDDPWVEHARWFPFCKFVLKIKGIDFIQASATGNPGNGLHAPVAPAAAPRANEPPLTISFVDACRIKEQRNPMYSAAAQSTRTMGYSRVTIRIAINKFIALTGRRDFKSTDLMDIIMEMEDAGQELIESDGEDEDDDIGATASRAAAGGMNATDPDEEMELTPAAMRKENEYLKTKFKCKVCDQRERCIVFVPCGHRITCQRCGEQAVTCPHCNSRIDQRFKTYLG